MKHSFRLQISGTIKCMHILVFIVLNVRDGTESKYPSIVFLSIRGVIRKFAEKCNYIALLLSIAMEIYIII